MPGQSPLPAALRTPGRRGRPSSRTPGHGEWRLQRRCGVEQELVTGGQRIEAGFGCGGPRRPGRPQQLGGEDRLGDQPPPAVINGARTAPGLPCTAPT